MSNITSVTELKFAIQTAETNHAINEILLKQQFHVIYESLKPVNIFKNIWNDITLSPGFTDNIIGTVKGLATGYLTKKIVVGESGNIFRNIVGSLLQMGVSNFVTKHPGTIDAITGFISQQFFSKKKKNTEQND